MAALASRLAPPTRPRTRWPRSRDATSLAYFVFLFFLVLDLRWANLPDLEQRDAALGDRAAPRVALSTGFSHSRDVDWT